jgi:sugar phosphate isomerase/epimerase
MDRRSFIAALASTPVIARHLATASEGVHLDHIGLQLYTVRSLMSRHNMDGVLSTVSAIGYKEVEFAGYFDMTPQQIRGVLVDNGLTSPSTHVGLEDEPAKWNETVERSAFIGHKYVIVAWVDNAKYTTVDDWKRLAARFNIAAEVCKNSGVQFAYHNHEFEFAKVGGKVPYDILLNECDPDLVKFEMDVAWAVAAGVDPVKYFAAHPGRFPLLHVKDLKKKNAKKSKDKDAKGKGAKSAGDEILEDVGKGSIDWKKVLGAAKKHGTIHHVVEHDSPADPVASIRRSFAYLNALTI